jgi:hypothetical protein
VAATGGQHNVPITSAFPMLEEFSQERPAEDRRDTRMRSKCIDMLLASGLRDPVSLARLRHSLDIWTHHRSKGSGCSEAGEWMPVPGLLDLVPSRLQSSLSCSGMSSGFIYHARGNILR